MVREYKAPQKNRRISALVADILCLARSERAGTPIDVRRIDAAEEASRVASYYGPLEEDGVCR